MDKIKLLLVSVIAICNLRTFASTSLMNVASQYSDIDCKPRCLNKKNSLLGMLLFAFIAIFLLASVSALGITPGRTNLAFEPGLEREVSVTVINSDHENIHLIVQIRGELNQSILLEDDKMHLNKNENEKTLTFTVRLPQTLSPGLHTGEVVIIQLPDENIPKKDAVIAMSLAVATQIHVQVPYPGQFAEAELKVMGDDEEKRFVVAVKNRGKNEIQKAHATISILGSDGQLVTALETNDASLKVGDQKEIVAVWTPGNISLGRYTAKAVLDYDGNKLPFEANFEIGNFVLDLLNLYVNDFTLGGIAKFNLLVHNKWSESLRQAYAEMRVLDQQYDEIADVKSATYDLPPRVQTTMDYYWDTQGVVEGLYKANILVYYGDKRTQRDVDLDVSEHAIQVIGLGRVISSESAGESSNLVVILSVIIGFLILLNVLWFVVLRKRKAQASHRP